MCDHCGKKFKRKKKVKDYRFEAYYFERHCDECQTFKVKIRDRKKLSNHMHKKLHAALTEY